MIESDREPKLSFAAKVGSQMEDVLKVWMKGMEDSGAFASKTKRDVESLTD